MSYFDNYKSLLPYFELYLSNCYKAVQSYEYCQEYVDTCKDRNDLSEDENKVYEMCRMVLVLDNLIECIKTENREEFDKLEPLLNKLVKDLMTTLIPSIH